MVVYKHFLYVIISIIVIIGISVYFIEKHSIEKFQSIIKLKNLDRPNMSILRVHGLNENIIHEFENFLDYKSCQAIIDYSKLKVMDSKVMCADGNQCYNKNRTSKNIFLRDDESKTVMLITEKIERILGIDRGHFEDLQVVNYKPGKEYREHWDACVTENLKDCGNLVEKQGQRYATFIIYLNDGYKGGETCFPRINGNKKGYCNDKDSFKIVPKRGKGVLFFNLTEDGIRAKNEAMHAGLPPINGEKWMCNKWIRTRKKIE